jgi:hypothetical protein
MQKWEYLFLATADNAVSLTSSRGQYLSAEYYKSIDPEGRIGNNYQWVSAIEILHFLAIILDKLGSEGWEAISNVEGGDSKVSHILLKRPIN